MNLLRGRGDFALPITTFQSTKTFTQSLPIWEGVGGTRNPSFVAGILGLPLMAHKRGCEHASFSAIRGSPEYRHERRIPGYSNPSQIGKGFCKGLVDWKVV